MPKAGKDCPRCAGSMLGDAFADWVCVQCGHTICSHKVEHP